MRHIQKISKYKDVVLQMDTTYWGRQYGLMVIKDAMRKKILWHKYVRHETIASYMEGIIWQKEHGFKIYGVVIDGIRGLARALHPYPVQLCQFHQMMRVRLYLTQEPELDASVELLDLVKKMSSMQKEDFLHSNRGSGNTRASWKRDGMMPVLRERHRHICVQDYAAPI